jgi:hypothetical protein
MLRLRFIGRIPDLSEAGDPDPTHRPEAFLGAGDGMAEGEFGGSLRLTPAAAGSRP